MQFQSLGMSVGVDAQTLLPHGLAAGPALVRRQEQQSLPCSLLLRSRDQSVKEFVVVERLELEGNQLLMSEGERDNGGMSTAST